MQLGIGREELQGLPGPSVFERGLRLLSIGHQPFGATRER